MPRTSTASDMAGTDPHVYHLITRLLRGGAEAKTVDAVTGLDGYRFTVGHGDEYDPEQVARLSAAGIDTDRFRLLRHYNPVTAVPAVFSVAATLRRRDVDVVHTHSTEAGIVGRFAAALADVPAVVHTVHGVPFTEDRNGLLNRFVLACERRAAAHTDLLVANADAITEEYLSLGIGVPEQYATVYSGIDVDAIGAADPASDLPGDRPRIVFVGRLVEGKGLRVLLDAVERLEHRPFSVAIVGDGPLADEIDAEIDERGLSDDVFLLGYRDDVPSVLAASDLLVLPSFREGTPRVVSEAMAAGLPVVATDVAGVPEQVDDGETGFLVSPGDVETLVDRVDRLLADPDLRASFGEAARSRAERFSREAMLADLDDCYRAVLDR